MQIEAGSSAERRSSEVFLYFVIALSVIVPVAIGQVRFIARDEGFYLYAARLISGGSLPYRDFFFPQTPLTPFVYAGWFTLFGVGWSEARLLASLLTVAAGLLIHSITRHQYNPPIAALALIIFSTSVAVQVWLPTAQTHSISITLLLAAFWAQLCRDRSGLAGVFFGFSVLSRLTVAPVVFVFIFEIWLTRSGNRGGHLGRFILGCMVPAMLGMLLLLADPTNFIEHNFKYHLYRTTLDPVQLSEQRWKIFSILLGLRAGVGLGGLQFPLIFYSGIIATILRYKKDRFVDPLVASGLILFLVHLIPSPPYLQYFCLVFILFIPASLGLWFMLFLAAFQKCKSHFRICGLASILAVFVLNGVPDMNRFLRTGKSVIGVGDINRNAWRISSIERISRMVDDLSSGDELILTSWPGYTVETRSYALSGLDSNFGPQWASRSGLSKAEQDRKKVLTWERALNRFRSGQAPLAVVYLGKGRTNNLEKQLVADGARKVAAFEGIAFYRRDQ